MSNLKLPVNVWVKITDEHVPAIVAMLTFLNASRRDLILDYDVIFLNYKKRVKLGKANAEEYKRRKITHFMVLKVDVKK